MLSLQEKWLLQGSLAAKKPRLLSKGNCHLSFWITAQHSGLSDLCRKYVNCETHQINLLNLKHLFAFNLNL